MIDQPRIFVASSSEQVRVAKRIAKELKEPSAWAVHVWDKLFSFSAAYIESLENELDRADFAVVVLTGDDLATVRDQATLLPRDNVIFELGLFMGRLGRPRCFFFVEGESGTRIASDLSGVQPVNFYRDQVARSPRKPGLSAQAARVKKQMSRLGGRYKPSSEDRREQEALWRFMSGVAGHWWERVREDGDNKSALSYFSMSLSAATNAPKLEGKAYDRNGKSLADWRSVASSVVLGDKPKIYYQWEGQHEAGVGQTYGGHCVITFDDGRLASAEGQFSDTNFARLAEGETTRVRTFRLYRCDASEKKTMQRPFSRAAKALVKKRLKDLRG
jgi:hypothetical protein